MDLNLQRHQIMSLLSSLMFGLFFVYLTIVVIGYGAAIAVPANILNPVSKISPTLALSLVDLLTIGIPLAIIFYVLAWIFSRLVKAPNLYLMIAPMMLLALLPFFQFGIKYELSFFNISLTVVKTLPLILCAVIISKQQASGRHA